MHFKDMSMYKRPNFVYVKLNTSSAFLTPKSGKDNELSTTDLDRSIVQLVAKEHRHGVGLQSLWEKVIAEKGLFPAGPSSNFDEYQSAPRTADSTKDIPNLMFVQGRFHLSSPSLLSLRGDSVVC